MIYNMVGDLLKQDKVDIICHQTNCKGVMGAGIAFQIKRTYPEVFKKYKEFCDEYENILLGRTLFVNCNDGKVVANLFGQDGYGRGFCHCEDFLQGKRLLPPSAGKRFYGPDHCR